MAKFIKFNCTAAANQPTVLIAIDQIAAVTTNGGGTATTIQLNTSATANKKMGYNSLCSISSGCS